MKYIVYIVDVRNLILGNHSTRDRHLKYAELLSLRSGGKACLQLICFKNQKSITLEIQGGMETLTLPSNPIFFTKSLLSNKIKESLKHSAKVLVAGDPWESAFLAYFLKLIFFTSAKIQVQIHGDVGNKSWITLSLRNRLRGSTARFAIQFSDQIRMVSRTQMDFLISRYQIPTLKCKVIPVPSLFLSTIRSSKAPHHSTPTIGFVGRIQSDRGINQFLELIASLKRFDLIFSVVIAGDGPERQKMESELAKIMPRRNLKFLGHLNHNEMYKIWNQIGVLVSTAPTESYGRAIREALAWGIPVWASPSSGVTELQAEVSPYYVKCLELNLPSEQQVEVFKELLSVEIPLETRKKILQVDKNALESLIGSWIELLQN